MKRAYFGVLRDRTLLVLGILLVLRVIALGIGPSLISGDGLLYTEAAQHIAQTGYLPSAGFQSRAYSVMIAPLVALLGHDAIWVPLKTGEGLRAVAGQGVVDHPIAIAVHWLHLLLDLAVVVALLRLCFALRPRSRWAFRAACLVVVLQPITAVWTNFVLPDTVATAGLFVGLFYIVRGPFEAGRANVSVGALLLGLAGMVRIDVALLAAAVLGAWILLLAWRGPFGGRFVTAAASVLLLFAAPTLAMAGYQYASSGEASYIRTDARDNPGVAMRGFFAWTRTWISTQGEFKKIILTIPGIKGWNGFDASIYPEKSLPAPGDRVRLKAALDRWATTGYDPVVDAEFMHLAKAEAAARPAMTYLYAPGMRTLLLWVNPDGGSAVNLSLRLRPPLSWAVAGATGLLKLLIGLLAAVGAVALVRSVWWAPDRLAAATEFPAGLVLLSLLAVVIRVAEMWALNIVAGGAVMESRYAIETWPCLIAAALYGWSWLVAARSAKSAQIPAAAVDTPEVVL